MAGVSRSRELVTTAATLHRLIKPTKEAKPARRARCVGWNWQSRKNNGPRSRPPTSRRATTTAGEPRSNSRLSIGIALEDLCKPTPLQVEASGRQQCGSRPKTRLDKTNKPCSHDSAARRQQKHALSLAPQHSQPRSRPQGKRSCGGPQAIHPTVCASPRVTNTVARSCERSRVSADTVLRAIPGRPLEAEIQG